MNEIPLASRLEGKQIGKWKVKEKRIKDNVDKSGAFSTCYAVEDSNDNTAFMKTFNYVYALNQLGASADRLKELLDCFVYERDLLIFCSDYKMSKVVTAIDYGEYRDDTDPMPVPYLVFELAHGDLHKIRTLNNPGLAWKLRSFHGALVGLSQLHGASISHQDIKPSNILIFGNHISKISDLGCATQLGNESNLEFFNRLYGPIELHYGYFSNNWETLRFGADFFMMGGVLTYLIADSNFLSLMLGKIDSDFQPYTFGGSYTEALPYVMKAYHETLDEIEGLLNPEVKKDLLEVICEMTHPIPEKRGNPQNMPIVRHRQFSLQKYISITDRISKIASMERK